jgi:hypothetical protein
VTKIDERAAVPPVDVEARARRAAAGATAGPTRPRSIRSSAIWTGEVERVRVDVGDDQRDQSTT